MIYTINKVDYPCSGSYNNVEASVVYNNTKKEYYILITPQRLEGNMVSIVPTDCSKYLLRAVNRRTKKRDAEANNDFISKVSALVSLKFNQYNLTLL